jgi:Tol biopolymer transport system component
MTYGKTVVNLTVCNRTIKPAFVVVMLGVLIGALVCVPGKRPGVDSRIKTVDRAPHIFPDYIGTTIPPNIAPLDFRIRETASEYRVAVHGAPNDSFLIYSRNSLIAFPEKKWRALLSHCRGKTVRIDICVRTDSGWARFIPLVNSVALEDIDNHLVYRLINPSYNLWGEMGIYQRDLESFRETAIITNKKTNYNCLNCHSFCQNNPALMVLHARSNPGGTLLCRGTDIIKIKARAPRFTGSCAYPAWHPNGRLIAFSANTIFQIFPSTPDWHIEVYDSLSDLALYDCDNNTLHSPAPTATEVLENMPNWSPDGAFLYYCSARPITIDYLLDQREGALYRQLPDGNIVRDSADFYMVPGEDRYIQSYRKLRYDLMRVSYDFGSHRFGTPETVLRASETGKSIAWPRVSPDGRYLMFVMSAFGYFTINHPDADLYCMEISSRRFWRLDSVNSDDVESHHSWSSNGRWFVFSSKRTDGVRARPYICYFDSLGRAHKPFILPQKDPEFYTTFLKCYNLPELINGEVRFSERKLSAALLGPEKDATIVP